MVSYLDAKVGEVQESLLSHGLWDDTLMARLTPASVGCDAGSDTAHPIRLVFLDAPPHSEW